MSWRVSFFLLIMLGGVGACGRQVRVKTADIKEESSIVATKIDLEASYDCSAGGGDWGHARGEMQFDISATINSGFAEFSMSYPEKDAIVSCIVDNSIAFLTSTSCCYGYYPGIETKEAQYAKQTICLKTAGFAEKQARIGLECYKAHIPNSWTVVEKLFVESYEREYTDNGVPGPQAKTIAECISKKKVKLFDRRQYDLINKSAPTCDDMFHSMYDYIPDDTADRELAAVISECSNEYVSGLVSASGENAFIAAVDNRQWRIAGLLLEKGPFADVRWPDGTTALMHASRHGIAGFVRQLLAKGANANAVANLGVTALGSAIIINNWSVARMLLQHGVNPNIPLKTNGATPLIMLAETGHVSGLTITESELATLILEHGGDVNAQATDDGRTALIETAKRGKVETMAVLLNNGANINAQQLNGRTALMLGVMHGNVETVTLLLERGANPDIMGKNGDTALVIARWFEYSQMVEQLLAYGAKSDVSVEKSDHALHDAVRAGDLKKARALVAQGAVLEARCPSGETPLALAVIRGDPKMARMLLEQGADVNTPADDGSTPLVLAVAHNRVKMVKTLLDWNANVFAQTADKGDFALSVAAANGFVSIARMLIKHGAIVAQSMTWGYRTPYQLAIENGHVKMVRLLLKNGVNINDDDPLKYAVTSGQNELLAFLISQGADVNASNWRQQTPLMTAVLCGNLEAVRILLKHKADVTVRDVQGKTPLMLAEEKFHGEAVELLKAAAARQEDQDAGPN